MNSLHGAAPITTKTPPGSATPAYVDLDDLAGWIEADRQLSAQIDLLAAQKAPLEEARNAVRTKIQDRIGDAQEARVGGVPVIRWAFHKAGTYLDQKTLKADHPDLVEQYTKTKKAARPYELLDPADGNS